MVVRRVVDPDHLLSLAESFLAADQVRKPMANLNEKTRMSLPVEKWIALTVVTVGLYTGFQAALAQAVGQEAKTRTVELQRYLTREEVQQRFFVVEKQLIEIRSDQRLILAELRRKR